MQLKDKVVIVTGGSAGVGAAVARKFADAGAKLMLVARTRRNLETLAEQLRKTTEVAIFPMDVADSASCADLVKKTFFEFGRIDVLVNNAGAHTRGAFESVDPQDLGRMIDVNLRAPVILSRLVLPYLREAGGGAIINVGSLAGRTPVPYSAAYGAGKAGLRSLTYSLGEEVRGSGIKVGVVSPGLIHTDFIMSDIDRVSDLTFSLPTISTADEVATAIVELCGNRRVEQTMSLMGRILTTISYLFPRLRSLLRPVLERRGARAKAALRAMGAQNERPVGGETGRPGGH